MSSNPYLASTLALRPKYARKKLLASGLTKLLYWNIGAAIAYFVLACIGFAEGALGINASLLWPASGFSVFLIYKYGRLLLPGIWLGAVASSISLNVFDFLNLATQKLVIGLINGSAATLQAFLIASVTFLIHRRCKALLGRQVILFVLSVLLLGSTSAIISNLSFAYFKTLQGNDWLTNLAMWWMGDVIGVLVVAPLLTWLDAYANRQQNAFANAYFIGAIGTGVVLLIFTVVGHNHHISEHNNAERRQNALITAFRSNLNWAQRDASVLQDYFSNTSATREAFSDIAQPLLSRNPIIDQIAMIPMDDTATQAGPTPNFRAGFSLTRSANGEYIWELPEETYFPRPEIESLKKSLTPAQTRVFWETNEQGVQAPFVIALFPISFCDARNAHQCRLFTIIAVKINFNKLIEKIEQDAQLGKTPFTLFIQAKSNLTSVLLWSGTQWMDKTGTDISFLLERDLRRFDLNQAAWQLQLQENHSSFTPSMSQWLVFLIGISLTGLLTAYLNSLRTHDLLLRTNQEKLESEIALQTQKLREANSSLTDQIQERQKAQDNLKRSENHLRTLLDNIPDPVWLKSTKGEYLGFNKKVEQMFFRKVDDVIGNKASDYVDESLSASIDEFEQEVLNSKQAIRRQLWMHVPQFSEKRLMDIIKIAVADEFDNSTAILSIARDVTDQHYAEQALQEAKDTAEEATRAKSRFLANMSHEIRTPMNAVLGYAQLLITDSQLNDLQRERLEAILKAGQRLLNLINDILDLSKIEAGALLLREEFFDLTQEINDITLMMKERAGTKGLDFITQIDLPDTTIVKSDRQKIGQVLLNLLGNAIKFTPQGHIAFGARLTETGVEFTVSDTGPGIAEKEMQQLFSAFKQGKAGEDTGGTGLGLVISKHIVEHFGGTLELTSEANKGTQAKLFLPLHLEHRDLELPRHAPLDVQDVTLKPDQTCALLVVEDDPASRDLLVELLQKIGCKVTACDNGQDGLQKALEQDFAMVFTDIRMPELDGIDMLKRLRASKNENKLPVVAVSASSLEHERHYYLTQGFQEFIGKPYKFNDIYKALEQFSGAEFVISHHQENGPKTIDADWSDKSKVQVIIQQLNVLAEHLSSGDMQTAKKLLGSLGEPELGSQNHQQLQQAIRQYDADLAEQIAKKLLTQLQSLSF